MSRSKDRQELYELLVRTHAAELYRFAYRLCGEHENASDLVQEAYSEAWRSLDSLRQPEKARAWLFSILRYRYAHLQRDNGRRETSVEPQELAEMAVDEKSGRLLEAIAGRDGLQKALDGLDDRFKEPFLMVFLEGLTCAEAAEALGVPLGTVLSRIHRARHQLKSNLDRNEI
ncbi:MAG TPA: sigma-70 family RNA polymerase sigma factor [Candidatus Glassbacteria bacterium]|nr:sigma-70 family RNA polymerase sigma factor [Candidatus Glassbacteria bacterium]